MPLTNRLLVLFILIFPHVYAQTDSVFLNNGDVIMGELKEMDRGVAKVETDYSDDDFAIEWTGVTKVRTESRYLITLKDGERINGRLYSENEGEVTIFSFTSGTRTIPLMEIVYLKSVKANFWSKVSASVDIGYSYTKASNLQNFNSNSTIGYTTNRWSLDATYNSVLTIQDSVDNIERTERELTFNYYLPRDFYFLTEISTLSNTEQLLDLRMINKVGLGWFLVHTNRAYWSFNGGTAFTNEYYSDTSGVNNSGEAFIGTELNLFDTGDLSFFLGATAYPGITQSGRLRLDLNTNIKYDLPKDFYIKAGYSMNFDNQPTAGASDLDYVFTTGIGWEW